MSRYPRIPGRRGVRKTLAIMMLLSIGMLMAGLSACAGTKLTSVWKDDDYTGGPMKKILVIGGTTETRVKRFFENEFVQRLKAHATEALPGYELFPDDALPEKDRIVSKISDLGIDGVLITMVVEREYLDTEGMTDRVDIDPVYYQDWARYHDHNVRLQRSGRETVAKERVTLQTKLYDVRTEKPVWSAFSESEIEGSDRDAVRKFVRLVADRLAGAGLIE